MVDSLPFTDINLNLQGVLRIEEDGLILEWRKTTGLIFWGSPFRPFQKHESRQVHIPLSQLDSIEYKNPFYLFHAVLRIRVRDLELLSQVLGANGTEISLYCKKRYRHLAQDIANSATFQKLERVFPESRTSVDS